MDYSKKQAELDIQKWIDSENNCHDTCGEYNYCCKCNKNEAYPCACAYESFFANTNNYQTKKATTTRKTCTKKATTTSCKTKTAKAKSTSTAKKTTTRKTTKVAA